MDLVVGYDSDSGEKNISPAEKERTSNEVDIIEITDSDADYASPVISTKSFKNKEKVAEVKQTNDSKEDNEQMIECIDLEESDCDELDANKTESSLKSTLPDFSIQSDEEKRKNKKIDYLNLEGSESDEEEIGIHKNVHNILNSAVILNDIPCGPNISDSKNEQPIKFSNLLDKSNQSIPAIPFLKSSDSSLHCNENINKKDILQINTSDKNVNVVETNVNKRFKRDTETPKSSISVNNADNNENEEVNTPGSFMYRKDERIATAFSKNVVCRLPRQITRNYISHSNIVTSLQWCVPQHSHLMLSASFDCTIKIWDMYCRHPVQSMKDTLGLKAAKWSLSGEQVVFGGYSKKAHVHDVLSGKEIISYDIFNHVNSIEIHPYMEDIFLCGTQNAIFGYDLRVNSSLPVRTFLSKCEEVLDIMFLDENEFVCSTSVVSHDSADRTIMVWDFSSGAITSNQVYLERYTCPSLKVHPHDSCFIAQSNGDYIAAFSSLKPYKIKAKRYMGHKVSGYGVECDISPDGKYVASGDANGDIYFYNYANTSVINKLSARSNKALNRLKWHPALNSTLATATWDGHIQIWK